MNFCRRRFNLYLLPAVVCLLLSGCATWHHDKTQVGIVRVHVQSESDAAGPSKSVSVLRSQPVQINIVTDPILTEADVTSARVIDGAGGSFSVELKFEEIAGWKLEQFSAINPGKHLVIFGQWSDKVADGRFLAAPLIIRRMAGGTLVFTPDASREEVDKWVKGLNQMAKKNGTGKDKS